MMPLVTNTLHLKKLSQCDNEVLAADGKNVFDAIHKLKPLPFCGG